MINRLLIGLLLVVLIISVSGQNVPDHLRFKPWTAKWITGPGADQSLKEYGVYKFRRTFELAAKPQTFIVRVSADNRYKLFVNERLISLGPARGDFMYWNYETVDLAPYLTAGKNVVAALVWNDGPQKPEAQLSNFTAFILQGNSPSEEIINTNKNWLCLKDESHQPLRPKTTGYYVAGPGELVDLKKQIKNWEKVNADDSRWGAARELFPGIPKGVFTFGPAPWLLVPSPLPQMESKVERLQALKNKPSIKIPSGFPSTKSPVTIPPNSKITLLLDQRYLTNAYPTIEFSKGKNATIALWYAESLYKVTTEDISRSWLPDLPKGNRNEVEGKTFIGKKDSLISDGNNNQLFTSLWWRTYRYLQLKIETKDEPLVIEDIYGTFTGFPFQFNATLTTDNPSFHKNLEVGWRTARLCAFETYMDCPYYEQLQYIGDTRIQALVSLYNSGDERLVRSAIEWMDRSRLAEGITLSRYPTADPQMIPTFSLWWIGMVHDYWRYRPDEQFVKDKLPGIRQVLNNFQKFQQEDGSLKNLPYWIFTDWVDFKGWKDGVAPIGENARLPDGQGNSAILDLQLMWTFQIAAELEASLGLQELAKEYDRRALKLATTIMSKYWDESRKLFADTPEKNNFSQHANSLAILSGLVKGEKAEQLARQTLSDASLAPASIYFKYYLHLALTKAGLGNDYLKWLDKWTENINLGMTTWAEMSDINYSRSDCHAWGSSPNIEFFRIVLGMDSDGPGFQKVKIEPHLGDIKKIGGSIPHPNGMLSVNYELKKDTWFIEATLPPNTSGSLIWRGKRIELIAGKNSHQVKQ
jgi:alpha-L-rhamnosidase